MADLSTPSPTFEAPPAYEFSESDADRKLALATERSLSIHQDPYGHDAGRDDVVNEGDVGRHSGYTDGSTRQDGNYAPVRPLNFSRKKATTPQKTEKERPSWYNEAQLSAGSSSTSQSQRRPLPVPGAQQPQPQRPLSTQRLIPEEINNGHNLPPPPFAVVADSLDGPTYERYPSNQRNRRAASPVVIGRFAGQDLGASPPPSPPQSPVTLKPTAGLDLRQRAVSPNYNRRSTHAQQGYLDMKAPSPRPSSAYKSKGSPYTSAPRLEFNPSVAYGETKSAFGQLTVDKENQTAAAALYNSAVAAVITAPSGMQSNAPKVKRYTPSITSLPEYEGRQAQPYARDTQQVYASHDYATSRLSFLSTNSAPTAHYPGAGQYPQTAYPMQQVYASPVQPPIQQRWSSVDNQYQRQTYYQR